eukprot:11744240-Karenia_brevis.AAC.1
MMMTINDDDDIYMLFFMGPGLGPCGAAFCPPTGCVLNFCPFDAQLQPTFEFQLDIESNLVNV